MIVKKNITRLHIVLLILFLAAFCLFWYIADVKIHEKEGGLDLNMIAYWTANAGPGLVKFMRTITFFGDTWPLLVAYAIMIGYFILKKKYRYSLAIFIVSFGAWNLSKLFKQVFQRGRPELSLIKKPTDYSFPSGHALSSFVFCSILVWLVWQTRLSLVWKWLLSILLFLLTLSIGASRVVLNVHFTTDVIGGFALGIMWVILAWVLLWRWIKPVSRTHG